MSQDTDKETGARESRSSGSDVESAAVSRRRFIASVAAAGAAGSALSSATVRAAASPGGGTDYDVIVVGGGMAGSSAAREVSKAGLRTVLLEARNRLGGRTYFADFAGKKVELGGNYIYWLQPHVWAEVDRYKLPISDSPSAVNPDRWVYLKNGKAVEADIATFWPKVDQALTDYCSMSREVFPRPYNPHYTDNWKDYAGLSIQDRIDQLDLEEDVALTVNAIWSIMSHAPCNEGGFLEMLRWWAALGSNSIDFNNAVSRYALKNGTISLINAMIDDGNVEVQLSTPVSRISQKDGYVRVETETGQTMTAKHVIVTTPLNTWGDIEYEPAISDVKLKVAKEQHVGAGNKLHIMTKEDIGNVFLTADDSFGPLQYGYTYTTGPEGTHILSYGLDGRFDVNNLKTVSAMIHKFLPDVEIEATYGYQWLYDPFSKGTWCTLRPHQFALVPELQRAEGNIHFASSDNASMWRGWMDGGIEMGTRVAQAISRELVA
ncbi:MAG: NAD(P)/FAD-dependent oxidoreductase [Pseudomonadota bacterium]